RVPVPDGQVDEALLAEVANRFHAEHKALYGYDFDGDPDQQVEWVNLRVSGIGPITRPEITPLERTDGTLPEPTSLRPVFFVASEGWIDTPVMWRADLPAGATLEGPVIVEEFGSTVPVHPGFTATVDDFGNLIVRRQA